MRLDDVMELTPSQIWYLFDRAPEVGARQRLELVADLTSVAAPSQFKDGVQYLTKHMGVLKDTAGF